MSSRARRITLRIDVQGRVSCTRPRGTALAHAQAFAASKAEWIASHLSRRPPILTVAPGARLPVEGRPLLLKADDGPPTRDHDRLLVPSEGTGPAVARWLRDLASERLRPTCARHASRLGLDHGRIRLRDTRSRWGSCTARGDLMFSWRLAMAPPELLGYVAAHEVAHLVHLDHSPAFWSVVEELDPDWRAHRARLREHGPSLLRWRF